MLSRQSFYSSCAALILSASLSAQASQDQVVVGAGSSQKCSDWISASVAPASSNAVLTKGLIETWLQGYLSAMNAASYMRTRQWAFGIPDVPALQAMLEQKCRRDPLMSIYEVSVQMAQELELRNPPHNLAQ